MSSDMDTDLPASELDRSELLDVLRRTMEAAGMDVGADVRDLPARVAYLRRQAEAQPLRRDPWAEGPEPNESSAAWPRGDPPPRGEPGLASAADGHLTTTGLESRRAFRVMPEAPAEQNLGVGRWRGPHDHPHCPARRRARGRSVRGPRHR
jgi:hypothetical protein